MSFNLGVNVTLIVICCDLEIYVMQHESVLFTLMVYFYI